MISSISTHLSSHGRNGMLKGYWFIKPLVPIAFYLLLSIADQLGGINGMISCIHRKLQADPHDAQGRLILGKLYLAEQHVQAADVAMRKAHELQPQDEKITYYYHAVLGHSL